MTTLMTRMFRARCTGCQVGQGRLCQCQDSARVCRSQRARFRFEVSSAQFWWTVLIALTGFWGVVIWRAVEACK